MRQATTRKKEDIYTKSQVGSILAIWGADPVGSIFAKIGKVVGVHDVIIHSTFGLNFFRGFRSTAGQSIRFSIDFAGHRYNSAAATAHPVIMIRAFLFLFLGVSSIEMMCRLFTQCRTIYVFIFKTAL